MLFLILNNRKAWFTFSMVGLSTVVAQFCILLALYLGQVIVVAPLVSFQPLFVLILAGIFLRKVERVTWKIVLGSVLIVCGTIVLTTLP